MDFSVPISSTDGSKAGASLDWLGAAATVADSLYTNDTNKKIAAQNLQLQRETNQMNKELTQLSWMRDDNAVQRRVKDLKAAGLSPLLAAGSAAGNSNPIPLNAPHNDYRRQNVLSDALPAMAAVESIKGQKLDNALKSLNAQYFGMPDWLIGVSRILNETPEDNPLHRAINKVLSFLGVDLSDFGGDNTPDISNKRPWVLEREETRTKFPVSNSKAKELLESKGIDTTPPSLESHPKDFGITSQDLIQDGTYFIEKMRSDGKLTEENIKAVADTLGKRYNARKGDIFNWLMSLAGL